MGVETTFYFKERVKPSQIASAIANEFDVQVDLSDIRFEKKKFDGDFDRYCGYIRFDLNGFKHSFHFYAYNHISGGERDKTNDDTISGYACDENRKILLAIGNYFGGYYKEKDDSDEMYIPKIIGQQEMTNKQKLENLIAENIDYKTSKKVIEFIQNHKKEIIDLNFGL